MGLRRVIPNLRTIAACEIEMYAIANLCAKMETGALEPFPIWTDLKTFDGRPFRGKVDFIVGGYPCQGFSVAGKRLGAKDPRHLWPHIERIIKAVRPVYGFFENVAGHLTLGFPEVYCSLRDMGYSVEAGLFTASEVGAPHKRQRLFILAHREELRRPGRGISLRELGGQVPRDANEGGRGVRSEAVQCGSCMADTAQYDRRSSANGGETQRPERSGSLWPARPGQPQHEWEEPRVVEYAQCRNDSGGELRIQPNGTEPSNPRCEAQKGAGQAESRMGREPDERTSGVDPVANRVDRLRLLGNGCVPAQAAKAFRELRCVTNTTR